MSIEMASAEIASMLLADGRLPTGGHAHSSGLEPALSGGLLQSQVPDFIRGRLETVGLVEASATVVTRRWAVSAGGAGELEEISRELLARTPSAPLREASIQLGRGLARLASRLWPQHPAVQMLMALPGHPMRPLALGVFTAISGMDDLQAARSCLYDDAQTVASAALKLLPVDPAEPVEWLLRAAPTIETVAAAAVAVEGVTDIPATTGPLVEQWSLEHHARSRRIFRA
ncbi:urease accessory protein UreF [Rhodococcus erythropolis]|jgi:urease accessory protein|uniref:Probable urease accessory protein UreF n=1 Tax=Rhodococcus erythropolis (strain PR4 / NBRC 100887) TaxID=234621 RepID=C0ZP09_RHOE4|nr:urease accessory UreF family protein [Rhodococcus erythropolis]BAH35505.1 probable urease accessory protein UreF [Rhodococcus erythropolis PR4]